MASLRERVEDLGVRRIAQAVVVAAFLAFFVGVMGLWRLLAFVVSVWFENFLGLVDAADFADHRVHDAAFSLVVWTIVVGMVAQFRSPDRSVGAMLLALVPFVGLPIAFALTGVWDMLPMIGMLGAGVLLATLLHPAGRGLVDWVDRQRVNTLLLILVVVAAIPLLAFAAGQVDAQTSDHAAHDHGEGGASAEEHQAHVEKGHYMLMAAFSFVVVGAGLVTSLRPPGWLLPAAFIAVAVGVYGLASVAYPEHASSAGTMWGLAALLWAVVFVGAARLSRDTGTPAPYGAIEDSPTPEQ